MNFSRFFDKFKEKIEEIRKNKIYYICLIEKYTNII